MLNARRLLEYCEEHDIYVPKGATRAYLEAAVARHALHGKKSDQKGCFGFWQRELMDCMTCDYESPCFEVSMGTERDKYMRGVDSQENPKIRFAK